MVDIHETPATPPEDHGGDERIGGKVAAGILIALGWGVGVVFNVVVHALAPAGGVTVWWVHIYPAYGAYSLAVLGIGAFAGVFGVVLWLLAQGSSGGRFVLPGYDYSSVRRP